MVTFKQVARSYAAASRAEERNRNARARESARAFKEQEKLEEINNATEAVDRYETYVNLLMSVHKSCSKRIDWELVKEDSEPIGPEKSDKNEADARFKRNAFKPSFFDKIFGSQNKIAALDKAIEAAIKQDQVDFDAAIKEYEDNHKEWVEIQSIADGVLNKEPQSYSDALDFFQPFNDIQELGSNIRISFDKEFLEIDLHVNTSEVIPDFIVSQTKTGKLSRRDMPKGKFNELYQDYVCGVLLRVARETLAYLPIKMVSIHALTKMVDTSTGHLDDTPIVSAIIPPETLERFNFDTIDQSDSMQNFVHNMKFSKTNGFSAVDKVDIKQTIK